MSSWRMGLECYYDYSENASERCHLAWLVLQVPLFFKLDLETCLVLEAQNLDLVIQNRT